MIGIQVASLKKGKWVNVLTIGSPNEDYITGQNVFQWASLLTTLTMFERVVDPLNVVVSNVALAHLDDALEIEQHIFCTFHDGASPA